MSNQEIAELEREIFELTAKLAELRKNSESRRVPNYSFETLDGEVTLLGLFGGKQQLLAIHNMGQGCRYCTLWADGFNGLLPHLEDAMSVVLLSRDPPRLQRDFANSRNWRFRLASHGGGDYIREQTVMKGEENMPGAVVYERSGDEVYRKNEAVFGPGDLYCSMWPLLSLAGIEGGDWTPQYRYWTRPEKMDDGGDNLLE
ncbi:MAG: DUF899 family protein [Albidovulum sp.]|nr:DUF899 family protein [Albidovulum sp.]